MSQELQKAGTTAVAPVKKSNGDRLREAMANPKIKEQFDAVLKDNQGAFVATLIELYVSDSELVKCEPSSVILEALKAASLKLIINKALGHAYILPFKKNTFKGKDEKGKDIWESQMIPTLVVGYRGFIQMAMRTGYYRRLNADVVYEGEFVSKDKLSGDFDLSGEAISDKVIGYFAHFELSNGFTKTLYMTKDQVIAHAKRYSKSYSPDKGIWKTNFDEMATKTPLRNLLTKWGMLSTEMAKAIETDYEGDSTIPTNNRQEEINDNANTEDVEFDEHTEDGEPVNSETGEVKQLDANKTENVEFGNQQQAQPQPAARGNKATAAKSQQQTMDLNKDNQPSGPGWD